MQTFPLFMSLEDRRALVVRAHELACLELAAGEIGRDGVRAEDRIEPRRVRHQLFLHGE